MCLNLLGITFLVHTMHRIFELLMIGIVSLIIDYYDWIWGRS